MSDGEVSVLVILSDPAWRAYEKGTADEKGNEPRKGDFLICKRIVVISTAWGPIEERIILRIEELEYAGNLRITIGKPTPLLQRPSIVALRERIESLALGTHQTDEMEEGSNDEEEEEPAPAPAPGPGPAPAPAPAPEPAQTGQTESGVSIDVEMETVIDTDPDVLPDAAPSPSLNPQQAREEEEEQTVVELPSPLPTHTSPIVSRSPAQFQIDTQLEVEATQARAPPTQARNPVRRSRGGYSMGREGFETTRGDNLTGPQAPTLHQRKGVASAEPPKVEPPKDKLLNLLSKLPGQQPRNRTPEPSAPVSAQQEVTVEEVVVETPAKKKISLTTIAVEEDAVPAPAQQPLPVVVPSETKRKRPSPTSLESTRSAPRRIYRIPKNQQALLDDQSSWLPPAPGHEFPHPNVPVKLLALWNAKAEQGTNSPSQPSPIALIEQSSGGKSVEEVQLEAEADESESGSDSDELVSADELIEWSQSQSRSQALPPDSSAGRPASFAHTARFGSRNGATPTQGPMSSIDGATPTRTQATSSRNVLSDKLVGSKGKSTQGGSQRASPRPATKTPHPNESPAQTADSEDAESLAKQKVHSIAESYGNRGRNSAQGIMASQPASSSRQNEITLAGSSRPQASPAMSQTAKQRSSQHNSPLPPASGANARPVQRPNQQRPTTTPVATQSIPTGPRNSAPLADNHRGPVQASTQQTPHRPYKPTGPIASSAFATPSGAPTAPRAIRDARNSLPNRSFSGSSRNTPDPKPPKTLPFGGFYAPQPSGQRRDTLPAEPKKETPPSRPRNGTPPSQTSRHGPTATQMSEMETSVPRSLPSVSEHHQRRSDHMRDAQRRQW
jgi:hypothetical protein